MESLTSHLSRVALSAFELPSDLGRFRNVREAASLTRASAERTITQRSRMFLPRIGVHLAWLNTPVRAPSSEESA